MSSKNLEKNPKKEDEKKNPVTQDKKTKNDASSTQDEKLQEKVLPQQEEKTQEQSQNKKDTVTNKVGNSAKSIEKQAENKKTTATEKAESREKATKNDKEPPKDTEQEEKDSLKTTKADGDIKLIEEDKKEESIPKASKQEKPTPKTDKGKKKIDIKSLIKKYRFPLIIAAAVILIALAITIPIVVINAPKIFVRSAEDFLQDTTKKSVYILKKDITIDGDLNLEDDLDINLNNKTLKVKGTLSLDLDEKNDATINIGTLKKKTYINGGKIVADNIAFSANSATVNIYSTLYTKGVINIKALIFHNKVELPEGNSLEVDATDVTIHKAFLGTLNLSLSNLELKKDATVDNIISDEFSNAVIYGSVVNSVLGGNEISFLGEATCPLVEGANELYYQQDTARIDDFIDITEFHIVTQLETPAEINIQQEGLKLYCITSEVPNADLYLFTIKEDDTLVKEIESPTNKADITQYIREPKAYNISVQASSENTKINLPSGIKEITYRYSIKLDNPDLTIMKEEDGEIILSFPAIDFATVYVIDINGKTLEEKATDDNPRINLTDEMEGLGIYDIKVKATNPDNSSFLNSDTIMISYLQREQLNSPIIDIDRSDNKITLTWDKVENATNYIITFQGEEKFFMTTSNSYTFLRSNIADGTTFKVYAQGKGYYLVSNPSSITYEFPQLASPKNINYRFDEDNVIIESNAVENAENYILYVNGERKMEKGTPIFTLTDYNEGDTIKIKAEAEYYRSSVSTAITIVLEETE